MTITLPPTCKQDAQDSKNRLQIPSPHLPGQSWEQVFGVSGAVQILSPHFTAGGLRLGKGESTAGGGETTRWVAAK